ncbi:MAG: helix-turn-helix transcriptional regulator [Lachnospiraceae bacterium]|nr:helix-turn-helix transcriptional regulator [Lachnospiraceae bacterium]
MYDQNTLKTIYGLSRIPMAVYTKDWKLREVYAAGQRQASSYEARLMVRLKEELDTQVFCFLPYEESVPIALCGYRNGEAYYVLGPFAYGRTDNFACRSFIHKNKIAECPPCQLDSIITIVRFLAGEELSEEQDKDILDMVLHSTTSGETQDWITKEELRQFDSFQKNHTYKEEQALFAHIERGETEYLRSRSRELLPSHPVLIEDLKKNEEYMAVISISLAARAAIEGGLGSGEGFINNDIFLKKLSLCKTVLEIQQLEKESMIYFAELVARHRKSSAVNQHVEECKRSILAKRFEPISIREIAGELNISQEYLQKLFKKYEGISITEYAANTKIEAACNMLRYSDRKIQEIAEYLHYGSVSHFSTAFRKRMKQSPRAYRDEHKQTIF